MDLAVIALCLGMAVLAWYMKKASLMFMSILCWMGFAAYMYSLVPLVSNSTALQFDYHRVFVWVGIGMAILSVLQAISFRAVSTVVPEMTPHEKFLDGYDKMTAQVNQFNSFRQRRRRN